MSAPIICFVLGACATLLALRYFTHMFQLNAYKPKVQTKWLAHNLHRSWSQILALLLGLIGLKITLNPWGVSALFALFCWAMWPKSAKKRLVYTHRVDRLLFTAVVLLGLMFYCAWVQNIAWLPLAYGLVGIVVLVANYINMPFEAWRRHCYIVKAKKILRSCPNLLTIGITGSYGKTSVKYYLNTLLHASFNSLMTPESYNTPMGIVKTIRLCDIVHPKHGIITALGAQHLESFKTQANIIKTKYELSDALPQDGFLLVNGDNELIRNNPPKHKYQTYGLGKHNDYQATNVKVSSQGTSFTFVTPTGEKCDYQTRLLGEHNIINLAGALAMCSLLGIPLAKLKPQLLKIKAVPHRLELTEHGKITIIDDGFNSNPSGTKAALRTLSLFDDYKIIITPGMVELGEQENSLNQAFGEDIAKVCDYVILVGEKQTLPIKSGLEKANYPTSKIYIAKSLKDGLQHAYALNCERKKIILLENDLPDNY